MRSSAVRVVLPLALAAFLAPFAACRKGGGEREPRTTADAPPIQSPLIGSESVAGLEALHDTVYARALRGDTLGLLRLFVRDSVYRAVVWPTQPSYEPEREEVWNLVSGMNKANSNKGLRRLLTDVLHPEYGTARLPDFTVTAVPDGVVYGTSKRERKLGELRLFAAALCLGGSCQVLTYAEGGFKGAPAENDGKTEGL